MLLLLETLALAVAYYVCGKLGLSLAFVNATIKAIRVLGAKRRQLGQPNPAA